MANNKKMVEAITSRDEDFAKWYTDIVKKAELVDYSGVKAVWLSAPTAMLSGKIFRLTLTAVSKKQVTRMFICLCLFPKVFYRKKKTMLRLCPRMCMGYCRRSGKASGASLRSSYIGNSFL
mgnify:FL=1